MVVIVAVLVHMPFSHYQCYNQLWTLAAWNWPDLCACRHQAKRELVLGVLNTLFLRKHWQR